MISMWLGKEMISLSPPPRRTGRAGHLAPGSSNLRTPKGALMLWIWWWQLRCTSRRFTRSSLPPCCFGITWCMWVSSPFSRCWWQPGQSPFCRWKSWRYRGAVAWVLARRCRQ